MREAPADPRPAFEHGSEDEPRHAEGSLERKPDHLREVLTCDAILADDRRLRMHENSDSEALHRVPHGIERRIVEVAPGDAGPDLDRRKSEAFGDTLELLHREVRRLKRQPARAEKAIRESRDGSGDRIVHHTTPIGSSRT